MSDNKRKFRVGDLVEMQVITFSEDLRKGIVVDIVSDSIKYPGEDSFQVLKICNLAGNTTQILSGSLWSRSLKLLATTEESDT